MRLTRADIIQAAIVGLTLMASAIAVPVMASAQNQSAHNFGVSNRGEIVR